MPIRVCELGAVAVGHVIRGGVTAEGRGKAVLGPAFQRMGENPHVRTVLVAGNWDSR